MLDQRTFLTPFVLMQAKKKNRKNAKAEAEKQQAVDEDDAVLEAALGEKQRLLITYPRT